MDAKKYNRRLLIVIIIICSLVLTIGITILSLLIINNQNGSGAEKSSGDYSDKTGYPDKMGNENDTSYENIQTLRGVGIAFNPQFLRARKCYSTDDGKPAPDGALIFEFIGNGEHIEVKNVKLDGIDYVRGISCIHDGADGPEISTYFFPQAEDTAFVFWCAIENEISSKNKFSFSVSIQDTLHKEIGRFPKEDEHELKFTYIGHTKAVVDTIYIPNRTIQPEKIQ